jgi:replicative DNA helicase
MGEATAQVLDIYSEKPPALIPLGLGPFDRAFGGVFPKTIGTLVMDQSVGKSSTILSAALASPVKVGIVSLEDSVEMVGLKLLSAKTGVNGKRILLKETTRQEKAMIQETIGDLEGDQGVSLIDAVGADLDEVLDSISRCADAGCKLVYVDYLQKVRSVTDDRRNEVATVFTKVGGRAAKVGVAVCCASQVTNVEPGKMPRAYNNRETRDVANESRFIICGCLTNKDDSSCITYLVEKCSHGFGGMTFQMRRDVGGTLQEVNHFDEELL